MSIDQNNKVLLTGITGFLGSHTAIQLLNRGYLVRGTMRDLGRKEGIINAIAKHAPTENLELIQAELTSPTDWTIATQDIHYVQHIASPLPRTMPKDENDLIVPAREGVINVLKASMENGVKRVVMTSSVVAIGYGHENNNRIFTENDWTNITDRKDTNAYIRSKTIAEKAAWDLIPDFNQKTELVMVNPVVILGPVLEKDYATSPMLVRKLMNGEIPALGNFGFSIVDVRDVADMQIRAMEVSEANNKRLICNADNGFISMREITSILKSNYPEFNKRLPKFSLPNFLVRLYGLIDPEVKVALLELSIKREFDNSLAKALLDWKPRSNEEAIKATADSLIELGLV